MQPANMQPANTKPPARINVRRLSYLLLVCLILPVLMGLLLDILLETTPLFTVSAGLFCIAVASVVVIRTATLEFNRVADEVAPAPAEEDLSAQENL